MNMLNDAYLKSFKKVIPSTQPSFKDKIIVESNRLIKHLFTGFGKKMEATAGIWAERLYGCDYTLEEIEKGVEYTITTCEKLPSYAEFRNLIRLNLKRDTKEEIKEKMDQEKIKSFQREYALKIKAFKEKFGEDKLTEMTRHWYSGVFGNQIDNNFPLKTFYPIFIEDLLQAKGDIEKAIKIGRVKNENIRSL